MTKDAASLTPGPPPPRFGASDLEEFEERLAALRRESPPPGAPGVFQAYTDGACLANPRGPGGWGAVVEAVHDAPTDGTARGWELWGHLSSTSNNRAEILGMLAVLEWLPPGSTLLWKSDSQYTLNVFTGAFKAKANLDLWTEVRHVREAKRLNVQASWVRGHVGDRGNERADRLAALGAYRGDVRRVWGLGPDSPPPPEDVIQRAARQGASGSKAVPAELEGLAPRGSWETSFVQSLARQVRQGRALSEKQQAVVDRIRARGTGAGGPDAR